jgi:RND family efflux transporter MFP subunit
MKNKWLVTALMVTILATTACSTQEQAAAPVKEVKHVVMEAVKAEQAVQVSELSGTLEPSAEALVARASYNQAVIAQEVAATTLAKTQLRAPINGTIIAKLSSTGTMVSAGSPVYQVGNIDTLKVVLPVPDREISAWKEGETIPLDLYGQKRDGKVVKIFPATNQSTGTIGVEVQLANPKHDWFAGQVVKAIKTVKGQSGIYVPVEAVISRGNDDAHVFVNLGGKAVKTAVTIGQITNDKLEIQSGLKEGDQLIVKGVDRLFDGDPIEAAGGTKQ